MKGNYYTKENGLETYKTYSLNIVAFAITKGIRYYKKTKINNSMQFEFEITPEFENCLEEYRSDNRLQAFISSLKEAKRIVME